MRRALGPNAGVAWLHAKDDPEELAGAAFLISANLALSCAHVIRDHLGLGSPTPRDAPAAPVVLRFEALECEVEATVRGWWPDGVTGGIADVAVLKLHEPLEGVPCAALAVAWPRQQEPTRVFGATSGYQSVGQHIYAQIASPDLNARRWWQLDAEPGRVSGYFVGRGFSGAPVYDPVGNAIWGMVVAVDRANRQVAFAIPAGHLREVVDQVAAAGPDISRPEPEMPGPVDELARDALVALRDRYESILAHLAQERGTFERQIEELREMVATLAERAREPTERAHITDVLEAAGEGEMGPAERLLEDRLASMLAETPEQRAESYRQLGALAFLHDTAKALSAYRAATRLDPDDAWSWIFVGRLHQRAGNLDDAKQASQQAYAAAKHAGDEHGVSVTLNDLGDVRAAEGDLAGALQAYQAGQAIVERLAQQEPLNLTWQRALSVSHERIGQAHAAQGNLTKALEAYGTSLSIAERLVAQDPRNATWQRDLSVCHNKIGDVRVAHGDLTGALEAYEASLSIRERLAADAPRDAASQRDLSLSYDRIGNVRLVQEDLSAALEAYAVGLAIAERLTQQDPRSAEWHRDLAVSHRKIGDVWLAQGELTGAVQAYQTNLSITKRLAAQDPRNADWQRDLADGHIKLANSQIARAGSLDAYSRMLPRLELLASYGDVKAQQDLLAAHSKLSEGADRSKTSTGKVRDHYAWALTILNSLKKEGRLWSSDNWLVTDLQARLVALSQAAVRD